MPKRNVQPVRAKSPSFKVGFSIVELLTVIAIIVVLAGTLMPAVASARRSAKEKGSLSNLHQLGMAAELYSQSYEEHPWSPLDFRTQPEWGSEIWTNSLDPSRAGYRNRLLTWLVDQHHSQFQDRIVPFKVSYLAFADLFVDPKDQQDMASREKAGWLVDFGPSLSEESTDQLALLNGSYTRLQFDTSVRHHPAASANSAFAYKWLYCDPTPAERAADLK